MKITSLLIFLSFASLLQAKTILFIGDSLTEGYGVPKDKSYPALVLEKLKEKKKEIKMLNGSVSGSTTASGIGRLRWFLKAKPDILFIALGANDGLRGIKLDDSEKNLRKMIELAKKKGMTVVLAGMLLPPNYGEKYRGEFERMFIRISKELKIIRLPFLLE